VGALKLAWMMLGPYQQKVLLWVGGAVALYTIIIMAWGFLLGWLLT
jgi:hypothetical protein